MNRFQRQLERAMEAINQLQDEHLIVTYELRDIIAENKRLRFMQYGKQPSSFADALTLTAARWSGQEMALSTRAMGYKQHIEQHRTEIDMYFDVIKWKWVAEAVIPYSVSE